MMRLRMACSRCKVADRSKQGACEPTYGNALQRVKSLPPTRRYRAGTRLAMTSTVQGVGQVRVGREPEDRERGGFGDPSVIPCARQPGDQMTRRPMSVSATKRTSLPRRPKSAYGGKGEPRSSIRLDVGIPDHLAPLLGVVDNELAELGGRGCIGPQAQIDEPCLELRAGKRLIHELIEDGDDLRRRVRRRADPLPTARLVARHKFADRWNVRQYLDGFGCRHAQGSQLTCPDIADR